MDFDVVIIGAGMSGLAAGIRLAYYGKRVCILERHYACGGLNSYYKRNGRSFDVGLHALTNYAGPGARKKGPLRSILRQLRLSPEELDLHPQIGSEVRFPDRRLRFTNDIEFLTQEVAEGFPRQIDGFRRLTRELMARDYVLTEADRIPAGRVLEGYLSDRILIDMLRCPLMYYGSSREHDIEFGQFAILFRSIFCEGFARPRGGVRTIIKALVDKFKDNGGTLMMRRPVRRLEVRGGKVTGVVLESGETLTAGEVISSAGYYETMRLCSDREVEPVEETGRLSFIEVISILDVPPVELGISSTILFFNSADTFTYARPDGLIDLRSGVLCCPNNFEGQAGCEEGMIRLTVLANYDRWANLDEDSYSTAKAECADQALAAAADFVGDFRDHVVFRDVFTPRTIQRFTGHIDGAVYGAPHKIFDGKTRLENLFICGTDQGFLGIIGAMLSGIIVANEHCLAKK